jgi:3-deoxy-manno-octulosonate cytidylyltransferase (CMP-KDO synthetase)
MRIIGIIPARYNSSRFPGKPLVDIMGKSMVQRVYEQAKLSSSLHEVLVATDDQRIFDHVKSFGGNVVMTSEHHPSGTDRCYEAYQLFGAKFDVVINVQGDEPFLAPHQIDELASCFQDADAQIATLAQRIKSPDLLFNPNKVKVVRDARNFALYFSRHPLPFQKNLPQDQWLSHFSYYLHVGLYGYRTEILGKLTTLPVSPLEKAESLEQLRWLENGYRIKVADTQHESHGVDVPEDLISLLKTFGK